MSHRRPVLALVAAVILVGTYPVTARLASAGIEVPAPGIAVDVVVEPMDTARTQFMCRAEITDLRSGAVLSAPSLHVIQGRSTTGSGTAESGDRVVFTATVGEGGTSASYVMEYSRKDITVAKQKGAISLLPRPPAKTGV